MAEEHIPTFFIAPVPADVIFVSSHQFIARDRNTGIRMLRPEIESWCRENLRAGWSFESVFYARDYRGSALYKKAIRFEDEVDLVYFKMHWSERL